MRISRLVLLAVNSVCKDSNSGGRTEQQGILSQRGHRRCRKSLRDPITFGNLEDVLEDVLGASTTSKQKKDVPIEERTSGDSNDAMSLSWVHEVDSSFEMM